MGRRKLFGRAERQMPATCEEGRLGGGQTFYNDIVDLPTWESLPTWSQTWVEGRTPHDITYHADLFPEAGRGKAGGRGKQKSQWTVVKMVD